MYIFHPIFTKAIFIINTNASLDMGQPEVFRAWISLKYSK